MLAMKTLPLDTLPIGLLFACVCVLTGLALEGGYRLGQWRNRDSAGEKESSVGTMVAAILALLAFLLAFTFGLAANQFEARRQAVLDEANTIGTTYLRTRLLPEPHRSESARLLREYVDIRVQGAQKHTVAEAVARSEDFHSRLWEQAVQSAEKQPGPTTALYIDSLNALIDIHGVRVQVGLRNRIPTEVWLGLLALAVLSMSSVGYLAGLSSKRRSPAMIVLILAFACVLFLIADLDRSTEGFLSVSQQALIDLQTGMKNEKR
jgi:hypothetical protein